jgi:hypothetical protein
MTETGHDGHPEVIEISDLAEDLLPDDRAVVVRAHVGSCSQCADILDSLREIRSLLGELPAPEPMPGDVAARIDAALAAEAAREAEPAPGAEELRDSALPDVPRETSLPASGPRQADVPRGTSGPAGRPAGSTGPGRGGRRRGLLIAALSSVGVLAVGGLVVQLGSHSSSSGASSDSGAAVRSSAQGTGASAAVGADVARLLDGRTGVKSGGSNAASSPMLGGDVTTTVTAPDGSVTEVPVCVLKATQRTERPLAAEREDFHGVDSYLVVLPDQADADQVDAFVLTAGCTADAPARVLFQNSYPRG